MSEQNGTLDEKARKKIAERIQKVLNLAASSNEHEAALAAEKAQAILAEYNLSMSEVNDLNKKDQFSGIGVDSELRTNSFPWHRQLANAVAKMYFCRYFYVTHRKPGGNARAGHDSHHFVGAAHNIGVAKMMFVYLRETVQQLANEGAKDHPQSRSGYITSFTNACTTRLVNRIYDRIEAAKRGEIKTEAGTNLPALASLYDRTELLLQSYLNDKYSNMTSSRSRARSTHLAGMMDGRAAGDKIGLDQQLAQRKAAKRIASR